MLNTRSFSHILRDFSEGNQGLHRSESADSEYESHAEPAALGELLHSLRSLHLKSRTPQRAQAYHSQKVSPALHLKKDELTPPRPPHRFEPAEQEAFECLQHYSLFLSCHFDLGELKRAYRQAVKCTHPDRGGSSESFLRVRKSHQILMALLAKVS